MGNENGPEPIPPSSPRPVFQDPGSITGRAGARLVSYGADELSQAAINYRIGNKLWGGRNVAVFEYEVNGELKRLVISSRRPGAVDLEPALKAGVGHAERRGFRVLQRMGVTDKIKRVYTELEPCLSTGNYCARIFEGPLNGVDVSYSFPYPAQGSVEWLKSAAGGYGP